MTLKAGDIVRCVKASDCASVLTNNKYYEVIGIPEGYVRVLLDTGREGNMLPTRFELVKAKETGMDKSILKTLKPGDKLTVTFEVEQVCGDHVSTTSGNGIWFENRYSNGMTNYDLVSVDRKPREIEVGSKVRNTYNITDYTVLAKYKSGETNKLVISDRSAEYVVSESIYKVVD